MYIKSLQGGNPVIMAYRITPYATDDTKTSAAAVEVETKPTVEDRLDRLEQLLNSKQGGKFDGLL
jgi:hypothetical protein